MRDKVVIITGASSGIGAALAHRLGKLNAKLVLAARNEAALKAIADEYAPALVVPTDVTDETQCEHLIERTVEHYGQIDVLVNNAGVSQSVLFEDIEDTSIFRKLMDVNYLGSVYCTYYALPHLKQTNGLLVAVSSLTGKTGVPTRTAYAATKHAMQGFFDSLRVELLDTGVDVTVFSPGFVQSEVRKRALGADAEAVGTSHLDESNVMTADECARQMVAAMQQRKRDVIIADSIRSKLLPYIRAFFPGLVDRLTKKSVDEGRT